MPVVLGNTENRKKSSKIIAAPLVSNWPRLLLNFSPQFIVHFCFISHSLSIFADILKTINYAVCYNRAGLLVFMLSTQLCILSNGKYANCRFADVCVCAYLCTYLSNSHAPLLSCLAISSVLIPCRFPFNVAKCHCIVLLATLCYFMCKRNVENVWIHNVSSVQV